MITLFIGKAHDGEFVIEEAYFDQGGIKMVTSFSGPEVVDWATTLKEISDGINDSMYKTAHYLNVSDEKEIKNILGMTVDKFIDGYKSKFINM